eukprot:scaffold67107_cov72-Phaeocystis_antarctica.AAC.2
MRTPTATTNSAAGRPGAEHLLVALVEPQPKLAKQPRDLGGVEVLREGDLFYRVLAEPGVELGGRLEVHDEHDVQRLHGQRRGNGRFWRRLAREPEAVAGRPVAQPLPGSAEPPRVFRRALRRRRSRAGALPRGAL